MRGRAVPDAKRPLVKLIIGMIVYFACFFGMSRYGNVGLAVLARKAGIVEISPYAAASLRLFGILIVMLITCLLIRQMNVFFRRRRGFAYGLFVGGYMFLYSVIGFVSAFSSAFSAMRDADSAMAATGSALSDAGLGLSAASVFQDGNTILFSIIYFILVGITEELVFRGIAADLLLQIFFQKFPDKKPVLPAVIISGLIFSAAHSVNLYVADTSGVLVQMIAAFFLGMLLTAIYYRTGNIYVVIFLHILNDVAAAAPITILKSETSITDVISGYGASDLVMLIPYIIVLVFLLRPRKLADIHKIFNIAC